jgi:amino acid transporter
MLFFKFLIDKPVVFFLVLLGLLITVVPFGAAVYGRYRSRSAAGEENRAGRPVPETSTRFLGIQMDIAIVIFGLLLLLIAICWIRKAFSG